MFYVAKLEEIVTQHVLTGRQLRTGRAEWRKIRVDQKPLSWVHLGG